MPAASRASRRSSTWRSGVASRSANYRDATTADKAAYVRLTTALLSLGVRALERGAWFLSLAHDDAVIDRTLEAFDEALAQA